MLQIEDTTLAALMWGSIAAAVAALGAIPFRQRAGVAPVVVGVAYAIASGFMLAASYMLLSEGLRTRALVAIVGAAAGAGYAWWTHRFAGLGRSASAAEFINSEVGGYKMLLQDSLHAASEGVAMGAALALSPSLGVFLALTLAAHNVAEGMTLSAGLRARGMSVADCAVMCVITNVPQPLMAVVAVAVVHAEPALLPVLLGLSAGSLLYLVMTELLPGSYQRTKASLVALLVTTSAALIVLLREMVA